MYWKDTILCPIAFGSNPTNPVFDPTILGSLSVVTHTTSL
jgi:hypothetical protein